MQIDRMKLLLCSAVASLLCLSQILGNRLLILICLGGFMLLVCYAGVQGYELPVLLFFLPWTTLLRPSPDSISFYTLALIVMGVIRFIKNGFSVKSYYVGIALLLLSVTLISKIWDGYKLTNNYLMFIAMLVLYPMLELGERKYSFYHLTVFFALGIIIAALTAQQFATYPNIAKYIRVDSYLNITRRCGYYDDPNFYTAQITAAIAGCMVLMISSKDGISLPVVGILSVLLVYCGFLSGSKSFVLITICLLVLWILEILSMNGRITTKVSMLLGVGVFITYIVTSTLFQEKIDVILTRFSWADNASDFTTGRTDLWKIYISEILHDGKLLLIGQGFTNVISTTRASHNTLIQLVYQFGLIGGVLLIAWIVELYRDVTGKRAVVAFRQVKLMLLITGAFLPWMALDILFFDELFLITTYTFVGICELCMKRVCY